MSHRFRSRMPVCLIVNAMLSASALGQSSGQLSRLTEARLEKCAGEVARLLQSAKVIPSPPAIVVLDFTNSPDSHVTNLGIILADELSQLLNARAVGFSVVPRTSLEEFLKVHWFDREETRSEEVAKWVADQVHATVAVRGSIEILSDGDVKLQIQLLGLGPIQKVQSTFAISSTMTSLSVEPSHLFSPQDTVEPGVYRPGDPGLTLPVCEYCPNPQQTNLSVKSRYQGSVKLSVLVRVDGRLGSITVLKEAPYNLTTAAVQAAETWRLKPGKKDGQPVPVRVPIEITFRWY